MLRTLLRAPRAPAHTAAAHPTTYTATSATASATLTTYTAPAPSLNAVMYVDKLKDLEKDDIKRLWIEYHDSQENTICAVVEPSTYSRLAERSARYPHFILPVVKEAGFMFVYVNWMGDMCGVTGLEDFQRLGQLAQPYLSIQYYTDLLETKDLVLMRGEINPTGLNAEEAKFVVNQTQLFYLDDGRRLDLLHTFNTDPDKFSWEDLVDEFGMVGAA